MELFRDDPIAHAEQDRLGRLAFAVHTAEVLKRVRNQGSSSTVVGVIGPWGSGKSSVVALAGRHLPHDWVRASFEPWGYSDADSMMIGFFAELRSSLPKDKRWRETRKLVGDVGLVLSPLGKLTTLVGVDSSEAFKSFSKAIKGDTGPSAILKKAGKALEGLPAPILVTVDDLDRLAPDELLMVFKLVRFLGRLPNVYYLLCYDEDTLLDVLMQTDLARNSRRRAQDYLEKMVQVRLDVPPIREQQARDLFYSAINEVLRRHAINLDRPDWDLLNDSYRRTLRFRLRTPRSVSRFAAQLDALLPSVASDVYFPDFVGLTWLRTFEPRIYMLLHESRGELTGRSHEFVFAKEKPEDARERWRRQILHATALDPDEGAPDDAVQAALASLLRDMFVPLRGAWEGRTLGGFEFDELAAKQRVGHWDYFDRYFAFTVPEDDIADADVVAALDSIGVSNASSNSLDRLLQLMEADPARAARKLTVQLERGSVTPENVLRLLCSVAAPQGAALDRDLVDLQFSFEYVARTALRMLDPDRARELLPSLSSETHGLLLLSEAAVRADARSATQQDPVAYWSWADDAKRLLNEAIQRWLATRAAHESANTLATVVYWWRWLEPVSCREWVRGRVSDRGVVQTVADLLMVQVGQDETRWIRPLSAETLDTYMGIDFITENLDSDWDESGVTPLSADDFDNAFSDTPDNRDYVARASILRSMGTTPSPTSEAD
jgi:hypothetical protein